MIRKLRVFATPLAFLVVLVAGFGLLIPVLGFYWDDWPVIFTGRLYGTDGYLTFYQYDRPVSAWTYMVTFPILGSRPLNWQIFSLLLRWGTTLALWWTLLRLWPARKAEATWAALLFSIYPVFTQQAISVAYSQHWICYLLFLLSLGAMVQAHRSDKRWFWLLTAFSAAASLLQLLTMEYFAGLELVRPLILWFLVSERPANWRQRVLTTARLWLPYLVTLAGFVIWRLFFLEFPGEQANSPLLLYSLLQTPLASLLRLLQLVIQDTSHLLLSTWTNTFTAASLDLQNRFYLFSWAVALLAMALVALFLFWQKKSLAQAGPADISAQAAKNSGWAWQILLLGAAGIAFGMLPVWFTDRQIIAGAYSDRFGLAAMFGCSLLLVGLLDTLVRLRAQRVILISILVGLAIGMHLRIGNDYRWNWVKQTRFYWQLSWRAPALVPDTAIFSDGEIFKSVGIYSTSMAINLLYPLSEKEGQLPYWFSSVGREFLQTMEAYHAGVDFTRSLRFYTFKGNTRQGVVIYYEPDKHNCLSVLAPEDSLSSDLPAITVDAALNSNLNRILAQGQPAGYPPQEIFGPEPAHTWCYLYQKGALAWQQQDWAQVVALGDEAQQQGYSPLKPGSNTPLEWLPFIEGYARVERWQEAQALSVASYERDPRINARMCQLWDRLAAETIASPARDAALQAVRATAACPLPTK